MTSTVALARSNAKKHFLFEGFTSGSVCETVHGSGHGAWLKMWERVSVKVTGSVGQLTLRTVSEDGSTMLVERRSTGEAWTVTVTEMSGRS